MHVPFVKYQGTGNDFILIDARKESPKIDVAFWCDRKFGIGADGLMLLKACEDADFEMVYFNSDGRLSSMCGNGGRCIAHWAYQLGIQHHPIRFKAPDGYHFAFIQGDSVKLSMSDVHQLHHLDTSHCVLNTGSPHFVKKVAHIPESFVQEAKNIRNSEPYLQEGINVNFYEILSLKHLKCRTFERGVEDETLSCGTGVTAVALSYANQQHLESGPIAIETLGGTLKVHFNYNKTNQGYSDIFLEGPATFVFDGFLRRLA
jgi:diaminopimelate epimerase